MNVTDRIPLVLLMALTHFAATAAASPGASPSSSQTATFSDDDGCVEDDQSFSLNFLEPYVGSCSIDDSDFGVLIDVDLRPDPQSPFVDDRKTGTMSTSSSGVWDPENLAWMALPENAKAFRDASTVASELVDLMLTPNNQQTESLKRPKKQTHSLKLAKSEKVMKKSGKSSTLTPKIRQLKQILSTIVTQSLQNAKE